MAQKSAVSVLTLQQYHARRWDHSSIKDFSNDQFEQHYKLYEGYVKNTNELLEKISEFKGEKLTPEISELKRRFGFEFDGMRMHELYFENLASNTSLSPGSKFRTVLNEVFGSVESWQRDFAATGEMRGNGWVCLYRDENGNLWNHWIGDHEIGHLAGCRILLAMDVWEHAYSVDWEPTERPEYIKAFLRNVAWEICEERLLTDQA